MGGYNNGVTYWCRAVGVSVDAVKQYLLNVFGIQSIFTVVIATCKDFFYKRMHAIQVMCSIQKCIVYGNDLLYFHYTITNKRLYDRQHYYGHIYSIFNIKYYHKMLQMLCEIFVFVYAISLTCHICYTLFTFIVINFVLSQVFTLLNRVNIHI